MDFAEELAAFRTRTTDPGFAGLIMLGTEQHNITAGLLLGTLKIRRVAFLTTPETRNFPQFIAGLLGLTTTDWDCPADDHSSTLQVYRAVKALRKKWSDITDAAQIAVDVTGGRKPMSVGLEKAAHMLGLTTIYVSSTHWEPESGKRGPIPGSQFLVIPPNPYKEFGDLEAAEAVRLFHAHDYAGAERIFADLAKRVPDQHEYRAQADLAHTYATWDAFDLRTARKVMCDMLARDLPANLVPHQTTLIAQRTALESLTRIAGRAAGRGDEALATLANIDDVLPLLGSLHANACRREAQGRYDTAAFLRYRCLELISQHRLARQGVLRERPDFTLVCARISDFEQRYERVVRGQGRPRFYGLPDRAFGLFVGYMLLSALNDELVRGYHIAQIERNAEIRNKSILAHGYRLITKTEYTPFAHVVDDLLNRFFAVSGTDRQEWERTFTFVELT